MSEPDPDAIRAGDADRQSTVDRLRQAFAEGRLELSELDERVTRAHVATTIGELRELAADLPAIRPAAIRRPAFVRRPALPAWLGRPPHSMLAIAVVNAVVWFVASLARGASLDGHGDWLYPWWIGIAVGWLLLVVAGSARRHWGRGDAGTVSS